MTAAVYEIVNSQNGHRYIGSSVSLVKRLNKHRRELRCGKHHSQPLQRAWTKYGESAFVLRPLLICTPNMTRFYEQRCLDGLKPEYNVTRDALAPMAGRTHSPATRALMSQNMRGSHSGPHRQPRSAEHCRKMSEMQRGKVVPLEQRQKISATLRGNRNASGPRSAEIRQKMSVAQRKRFGTE